MAVPNLQTVNTSDCMSDYRDSTNDSLDTADNTDKTISSDEFEAISASTEPGTYDEICTTPEIKHPLENGWTLYYYKNNFSKSWNENNLKIATVHFIEDFWSLYNHVRPASKLPIQCDYSFFKAGIKPEWEDEQNFHGGKWTVNLDKKQRGNELDKIWLEAILCIIGELFEDVSHEICGIVVNVRGKGDKVCLWTANADNQEATLKIGRIFREKLRIPDAVRITYQAHAESKTKKGSMAKNRYTV